MKSPNKINGSFLFQLDQTARVRLYCEAGERDGLPFVLVCCEGWQWLDNSGPGDEKPEIMTVHEARDIIRNSIHPPKSFYVEPA